MFNFQTITGMERSYSDFMETRQGSERAIFAEKITAMLEIDDNVYAAVARAVCDAVGDSDFFNGRVECDTGGFWSTLTATLLVYRNEETLPEGMRSVISDIVPVWWEFSTVFPGMGEVVNDFSFAEMKRFIVDDLIY
jgi:hypothetical protein